MRKALTYMDSFWKQLFKYRNDGNYTIANSLAFNEKKECKEGLINGGVYVISRFAPICEELPAKFSFETAVLEPQCAMNNLLGVVQDGYFIDIGIPEDYNKANVEFATIF